MPLSRAKGVELREGVVSRPVSPWSASTQALLGHLNRQGFRGAPQPLGLQRSEHVTYIDGSAEPNQPSDPYSSFALGRFLREFHRAAASFRFVDLPWQSNPLRGIQGHQRICGHGDIAPWNVIWRAGHPVGLVDWELAGPIARDVDLAYAAWTCTRLFDDATCQHEGLAPAHERIGLLRSFLDGYEFPRQRRAQFVSRMIDVAVVSAANDSHEAGIAPSGVHGRVELLWGVAWRLGSARWLIEQRASITSKLCRT